MQKNTKMICSIILIFGLFLTIFPVFAVTDTQNYQRPVEEISTADSVELPTITSENITDCQSEQSLSDSAEILATLTKESQILDHVDEVVFKKGNHKARLQAEETLNSYVFLNEDNSKTVYIMDQPIKYIDAEGIIREKDLRLTTTSGGFTTISNDIQLMLPTDPSDGITLSDTNHSVILIPENGLLRSHTLTTTETVTYPNYFGEGMSLRYTPTLTGVKEDIILDAYYGIYSFSFLLQTDGLYLFQTDGQYYLARSQAEQERVKLDDIVSYDANGQTSLGSTSVETISAGQSYRLTITVDEAFLKAPETVYPVTIDPTMSFFSSATTVQDAPIFQGYPSRNFTSYLYNRIGYAGEEYGVCRTVMKLPGLFNDTTYSSLSADQITSVTLYLTSVANTGDKTFSIYPLTNNSSWTEDNVTWNNIGSWASDISITGYLTGDSLSAVPITSMVKGWKNGTYNPNCGFILIAHNETSGEKCFYSSEHTPSSYRPYTVLTYTSISLSQSSLEVDEGTSKQITVTTSPTDQEVTWSSNMLTTATVSSSGVVTGHRAGLATITATLSNGTSASCTVYVTIADGVYYVKNNKGSFLSTYGSTNENTSAHLLTQSTSGINQIRQLWKISHLSQNYYSIRPMYKLDMGLRSSGGIVNINTIGTTDTIAEVPLANRWHIQYGSAGYALRYTGSNDMSMRASEGSTYNSVVTTAVYQSNSYFHWNFEKCDTIVNQVLMYDTQTNTASSNLVRYVEPGMVYSLDDLNIDVAFVSNYTNNQSMTWSSQNTKAATVNASTGVITTSKPGEMTLITAKIIYNGITYSKSYTLIVPTTATLYSITSPEHDHYSSLSTTANYFNDLGITNISLIAGNFEGIECKDALKCTKIFASRCHGGRDDAGTYTCIQLSSSSTGGLAFLYSHPTTEATSTSAIIDNNDSFSNLGLALFIGCSTYNDLNAGYDLVTRVVDQGALASIGFSKKIDCGKANTWTKVFFENFLDGKTVAQSKDAATDAVQWPRYGLDSAVIVGDSSLTLFDLIN